MSKYEVKFVNCYSISQVHLGSMKSCSFGFFYTPCESVQVKNKKEEDSVVKQMKKKYRWELCTCRMKLVIQRHPARESNHEYISK